MDDLRAIISHIESYDKINVYYPRFENIVSQRATNTNVSGDEPMKQGEELNYRERSYLFEPNLQSILDYFKTQMISSLFKQTVHESQLARFASRIKAMEEALDNINVRSKELGIQQNKILKRIENKKQIERIAGISLWMK
jgi:F0F1-type ATP synthase gamma subunit